MKDVLIVYGLWNKILIYVHLGQIVVMCRSESLYIYYGFLHDLWTCI